MSADTGLMREAAFDLPAPDATRVAAGPLVPPAREAQEARVGRLLDRLRPHGFRTLHRLAIGLDRPLDHLVVGRPGVFAVTEAWHGDDDIWVRGACVRVSGVDHSYVRACRSATTRVSQVLATQLGWTAPVAGIVVFDTSGRLSVKEPPRDVAVLGQRSLFMWLRRRPESLYSHQVDHVYQVAQRPVTWTRRVGLDRVSTPRADR